MLVEALSNAISIGSNESRNGLRPFKSLLVISYTIGDETMKKSHGTSARGERAGKKEKNIKSKKINFSDTPELSDKQLSRMRRVGRPWAMNEKAYRDSFRCESFWSSSRALIVNGLNGLNVWKANLTPNAMFLLIGILEWLGSFGNVKIFQQSVWAGETAWLAVAGAVWRFSCFDALPFAARHCQERAPLRQYAGPCSA